jgi:hypothetical protein
MRTHENLLLRLLFALGITSVAVLFAGVIVLFATQHRVAAAAPSHRVVGVGGIQYEAMLGRPLDPKNPVDREILAGLPARERHVASGQMLFGAFISAANDSSSPLRTAGRIELRDEAGHVYRPLRLPSTNPYAYSQRRLRPQTRIPAVGSVADANLAATGRLVLFRIPAEVYTGSQALELVIHDPSAPGATASLVI